MMCKQCHAINKQCDDCWADHQDRRQEASKEWYGDPGEPSEEE